MKNDPTLIPIEEVADDSELLEQCQIGVCLEATIENISNIPEMWKAEIGYGECAHCGVRIFFRTNIPTNVTKVCMRCAVDTIAEDDNPQLITRKGGADEVREYFKKKEQN